jgi:elongator complex protein 1
VDANDLFDIALGMYNFGLVLLVVQHAQKDPREYLSFLRHLRDLHDLLVLRFAIDDYLCRYASALGHRREASDARFEEAILHASRHRLSPDTLRLRRGSELEKDLMAGYPEDLFEWREFRQTSLGIFPTAIDEDLVEVVRRLSGAFPTQSHFPPT